MRPRTAPLAPALALVLVLAGCDGDAAGGPTGTGGSTTTAGAAGATDAGPTSGEAADTDEAAGGATTDAQGGTTDADADAGNADEGTTDSDDAAGTSEASTGPARSTEVPALDVQVVADGLALPWDVQLLPDGTVLVTERGGRLLALDPAGGEPRELDIDLSELFVGSEAGLMGLAVSPDFDEDRTVYLCHAATAPGAEPDVRVTRWTLDEDVTAATREGVVVDGIPLSSGRHSGCRLLLTGDRTLLVGTGDAAEGTHPQDLSSLGGKVLAVTPEGEPARPEGYAEGADPRILTYGHRNVQGLALQPGTGTVWEVEHGPDVDDEVNVLVPGGNYGWNPVPGYNESVPMTDREEFPDAVAAAWSSGAPTHATSGAVFLDGEQWGAWDGALAVAELKGSGVTLLSVDGDEVTGETRVEELDGTYGRLRSLTLDADGALWVTSSNGDGDVVLRVTPRG